jgi:hypothetical protein
VFVCFCVIPDVLCLFISVCMSCDFWCFCMCLCVMLQLGVCVCLVCFCVG